MSQSGASLVDPYRSPKRPLHPYVIIDQNCLRDEAVVSAALTLAKDRGEMVMLTEATFYELLKSEKWDSTYEWNLRHLAAYPDGIVGCRSLGEMLEVEGNTGVPQWDIVDARWTAMLREHLGKLGSADDQFREANKEFAKNLHANMFTESQYRQQKDAFTIFHSSFVKSMPSDVLDGLKRGGDDALVDFFAKESTPFFVGLENKEQFPKNPKNLGLAYEPSATFHDFACTFALVIDWIVQGGLDCVRLIASTTTASTCIMLRSHCIAQA